VLLYLIPFCIRLCLTLCWMPLCTCAVSITSMSVSDQQHMTDAIRGAGVTNQSCVDDTPLYSWAEDIPSSSWVDDLFFYLNDLFLLFLVVDLLLLVGLSAFDVHGINNKYVDLHNNHEWIRHSVIVSLCGRLVYDVKIYYCRQNQTVNQKNKA
jgi:hypothetical protein